MTVRLVPLGGLGQIGLNCLLVEESGRRVMIDCGVLFPRPDAPGAAVGVPDFSYLRAAGGLDAVLLTHGHDDHIGALPALLADFPVPVYATGFTLALVRDRLEEHGISVPLVEVSGRQVFEAGPFIAEPVRVAHSIPDGVGYAIETGAGVVLHTGDWKMDLRPGGGDRERLDLERLQALGRAGVAALLSDSTNAEREGWSTSEAVVAAGLDKHIAGAAGRVVVALFASHVGRIRNLLAIAAARGRKVALMGRNMLRNIVAARDLGILEVPPGLLVEPETAAKIPAHQLLILCTGAQGEPGSGLWRLAANEARPLAVEPGDTVLLSARAIPGNERAIAEVVDRFSHHGVRVVERPADPIHASGHAHADEQRLMLDTVRPQSFVPIHGEHRMLMAHARTALGMGLAASDVFVVENGEVLELSDGRLRQAENIDAGPIWLQSRAGGLLPVDILRDRKQMNESGAVQVVLVVDASGTPQQDPLISGRGVADMNPGSPLERAVRAEVQTALAELPVTERRSDTALEQALERGVRRAMKRETGRRPVVLAQVLRIA